MSKQPDDFETPSLILLVVFIGWSIYTLYLMPHLLFNWHYDVPGWIWYVRVWFVEQFGIGEREASFIILSIMLVVAMILLIIEKLITKSNENIPEVLEEIELRKERQKALRAEIKSTTNFFMQVFMIAIGIFVLLIGLHWLISTV